MLQSASTPPPKPPPGPAAARGPAWEDPLVTLRNYLLIVRERWLLGLCVAILAASGYAYFHLRKVPVYEAAAVLVVETAPDRVVDIQQVVDTSLQGQAEAALNNHLEQLRSRKFLEAVERALPPAEREQLLRPYRGEDLPEPVLAELLAQAVQVTRDRNAQVFRIKVRHRDPLAAARLADRWAEQYIVFLLDRSGSSNESALRFLRQQAEELRKQVEQTEVGLQEYRQKHNLVSLEENQNIIVERLKSLNAAKTALDVERLAAQAQVNQVREARQTGADLTQIPAIAQTEAVPRLQQELASLEAERAALEQRYLRRHPRMVENSARLDNLRLQLSAMISRAEQELLNRAGEVAQRQESIARELAQAEEEALRLDRMAIDYNVLRRKLERDQQTFGEIITRLNETHVSSQLNNTNVRVIDWAQPPGRPVEPRTRRVLGLAALLFAAALIGVPVAVESIDNRLKTHWDIEVFVGKSYLGDIPRVRGQPAEKMPRLVLEGLDQEVQEVFRGIHSQLHLLEHLDPPKVLLVASTVPGEGKSFVCANLAATFAQHGWRTLVLDCDFRRPTLHRALGRKNDKGILAWLAESSAPTDQPLARLPALGLAQLNPHLAWLCSGGTTRQTTETIGHPRFRHLLETAKREFDLVLIDTPPVSFFPDTLSLAAHADGVIYVCRFNTVNRQRVKHCVSQLDRAGAPVLGIVQNDRTSSAGHRYGYYGTGYGYYYYDKREYGRYRKYYSTPEDQPADKA